MCPGSDSYGVYKDVGTGLANRDLGLHDAGEITQGYA